jgi:hypothetical protein
MRNETTVNKDSIAPRSTNAARTFAHRPQQALSPKERQFVGVSRAGQDGPPF